MTSAVDERGAEASPKFRVLLTASLIMFDSNIVAVSLPSIGRLGACLRRPVRDQRLRALRHQRASDCADARGGSREDAV
jgi:hypothetical protein